MYSNPKDLAIVIPAYKAEFLGRTLESLSSQTDKRFSVYVGDDASPQPLEEIVARYSSVLDVTYHRFDTNVGGDNLGKQWERCLRLMQGETFFCLFSDDDVMEPTCIERFYEAVEAHPDGDVFHFDIDIVDSMECVIKHCTPYPSFLSASDFLRQLYTYQIDARMPEFIFRAKHFRQSGGVIEFDLAYRSDNAIVLASGWQRGICTVKGAKVLWRDSGMNISSAKNTGLAVRRVLASIRFFSWLETFYEDRRSPCPFNQGERLELLLLEIAQLKTLISRKEMYAILKRIPVVKSDASAYWRCRIYLMTRLHRGRKNYKFYSFIEAYCLKPYSRNK